MARSKTREIIIKEYKGAFSLFKKTTDKKDFDFSGLLALRQLLSNERARMINVIKTQNPLSIYHLAKILNRSFKSVSDDIKLLERFGIIELIKEQTKKRKRLKPVVIIDNLEIKLNF